MVPSRPLHRGSTVYPFEVAEGYGVHIEEAEGCDAVGEGRAGWWG